MLRRSFLRLCGVAALTLSGLVPDLAPQPPVASTPVQWVGRKGYGQPIPYTVIKVGTGLHDR